MKVLEFILLIVSATSFLVYENVPVNTYSTEIKKELKEIGALHGLEDSVFAEFDYEKDSSVYSLSTIKSRAVFFNVDMLTSSASDNPPSLSLDWQARDGATNYLSPYHLIYRADFTKSANSLQSTVYEVEFEVEVSKFQFKKSWEQSADGNYYVSKGAVDNTYTSFKAKCLEECPFNSDILLEVVNAFLVQKKTDMNNLFNLNGVNVYYNNLPTQNLVQKVYTQTSNTVPNENTIDLTIESQPEYKSESGILFKRKAKLNNLDIEGDDVFSSDSSQRFNINKKLIQKLISENLFSLEYNQSKNPSPLYELTVAYLKQIVDVSSLPDTTELKVSAKMTDVTFNNEDAISGVVTLEVNVLTNSDSQNLLAFTLKLGFKFTPTLLNNGLNFVLLGKNISIEEVISSSTLKSEDLLRSWIKNTYLVYLGNREYNLLSLAFDLSFFFNTNKLGYEFRNNYLSIIKKE